MVRVGVIGRLWAVLCGLALTACGGEPPPPAERLGQVQAAAVVAPTISSFSPTKAVQGTLVTINGSGFGSGAVVTFNGASAASVTFVSSSRLRAVVPPGATTGPISVSMPAGTALSASAFGVLPKLQSVTPMRAFAGDFVTVAGHGFTGATAVKFGSVLSAFDATSDFAITAAVPAGFTSGKVTVTTPTGSSATTTNFLVLPLLTSFTPTLGPVGQSVSISGEGFNLASAVKFGTKTAAFSIVSDTELTAVVPSGATNGRITVETPRGNRTSAASFTVVKPPTISSFTPTSAELPTTLTVYGTNFVAVSAVKVGSVTLPTFTVATSKRLTAPVPPGTASGKISVVNLAGTTTSLGTFVAVPCSDVDLDSVCDAADRCPGFDDRTDSDLDGTADGCDPCPNGRADAGQSCGTGMVCDDVGACVEQTCDENTTGPGVFSGYALIDGDDTAGDLARLAGVWCVTGAVSVVGTSLTSLDGLQSVRHAYSLDLYDNPNLADLSAVANLRSVHRLTVMFSPALTSLDGFASLETIETLDVANNEQLASLAGLGGAQITRSASLMRNPVLTGCEGVQLAPGAGLAVEQNLEFSSLACLEDKTHLGWLHIEGNYGVTSLEALASLTQVDQRLVLWAVQVDSLASLQALQSVGSELTLGNLHVLDLDGLESLTSVGALYLRGNLALRSLAGLAGLTSAGYMMLENNWNLSQCEIAELEAQLGRPVDYNQGNGEACVP